MPTSALNRLATLICTLGSNDQHVDLPSSPAIHCEKISGTTAWRLSPSIPPQPQSVRDWRTAGPPREQLSQKDGASALPPCPKCSHQLLVNCMCEFTLPPSSDRRPSAV